jgi:hypothetical protein
MPEITLPDYRLRLHASAGLLEQALGDTSHLPACEAFERQAAHGA